MEEEDKVFEEEEEDLEEEAEEAVGGTGLRGMC